MQVHTWELLNVAYASGPVRRQEHVKISYKQQGPSLAAATKYFWITCTVIALTWDFKIKEIQFKIGQNEEYFTKNWSQKDSNSRKKTLLTMVQIGAYERNTIQQ